MKPALVILVVGMMLGLGLVMLVRYFAPPALDVHVPVPSLPTNLLLRRSVWVDGEFIGYAVSETDTTITLDRPVRRVVGGPK